MKRTVTIVGRPNVGKSTFFNRMLHLRKAIVDESVGVTRDRHYGVTDWNGEEFNLVDTGGYVAHSEDVFESAIREQVRIAIDESDLVLFMVDVTSGITALDNIIAQILRKSQKKVFVVVNKVDNQKRYQDSYDFYKLGLGEIYPVSSISGSGTGDLLDDVVNTFGDELAEDIPDIPKIGIIGRPNAGKSTFINTLVGKERNIVTPIPGTTRDTINTRFNKYHHDFLLVDTAGLRKKNKVKDNVEFYSVMRTIKAVENSDVCLLLVDAREGVQSQDVNIIRLVQRNHKGIALLVNKWDLIEKDNKTTKNYIKDIQRKISPFTDIPILFISALTKQRLQQVLDTTERVNQNRQRKLKTAELNEILRKALEKYPHPRVRGRYVTIKYANQIPTYYPSFTFFCNHPNDIKDSYKRYLENVIRKHFDFTGVPMELYFRQK